jgi:hypothetical protein
VSEGHPPRAGLWEIEGVSGPGRQNPLLNSGNATRTLHIGRRNLLRPLTGPPTVRRMAAIMNMVRRVRHHAVATGVGLASAH